MKKFLLGTLLLCSISVNAIPRLITGYNIFVPAQLGPLGLYHENNEFFIIKDDEKISIKRCNIDPFLREINSHKLEIFLGVKHPSFKFITFDNIAQLSLMLKSSQEITNGELAELLKDASSGHITINEDNDGSYILVAHDCILDGGVI